MFIFTVMFFFFVFHSIGFLFKEGMPVNSDLLNQMSSKFIGKLLVALQIGFISAQTERIKSCVSVSTRISGARETKLETSRPNKIEEKQ